MKSRAYVFGGLFAIISLIVVGIVLYLLSSYESEQDRLEDQRSVDLNQLTLEIRVGLISHILSSMNGLFESSSVVSRDQFKIFTKRYLNDFEGVQALEWIPAIAKAERREYEKRVGSDLAIDQFAFRRFKDGGWVNSVEHWTEVYYPVYYVEPIAGNEAAIGIDLGSNVTRMAALQQACDSGDHIFTGRITLAQEETTQFGFLVFSPVYGTELPENANVEEHRAALRGFTLGVFRVGDFLRASIKTWRDAGFYLELKDLSADLGNRLLYQDEECIEGNARIVSNTAIAVGGRSWNVEFSVAQTAETFGIGMWTVLILGALLSCVLGAFVYQSIERTELIRQEVVFRTRELDAANEELEQFAYRSSHDIKAPLTTTRSLVAFI
ncbi:MAG: CHASE domain-containing protein, partial [Planctomycetes bacterium]|nr:CHASE domain-containing protein [Planctomycetota bacterium]